MDLFKELNSAQEEAVRTVDGPVLVLAGAGSGKTKTLTHRIAHLIQNCGVLDREILAVTFTNKAASEMRQRLAKLLGVVDNWFFMPFMGTFHGICVKILRESGSAIQIDPKFVILDESDRQGLIKTAMTNLGLRSELKPRSVAAMISTAKNKMQSPDDYASSVSHHDKKIIAEIYREYEALRRQMHGLDFDDLLLEVVRLFRTIVSVRKLWQERFKFILIDEYQDTNAAQYQIVKLLVNKSANICVVGDDWQSVYSFRGADFTNILNFQHDFPGAKVIKLEQNYRSTGNILAIAQRVIEKNVNRTDKQMWTASGDGEPVELRRAQDESDEAFKIANLIRDLNTIYGLDEIAILYRANAQSYSLERALIAANLSYKIIGGVRFFDRKEIKDILAYLRLIYQPYDQVSLARIMNVPARGIGKATQDKFLAWWQTTDYDLFTALTRIQEADLSSQTINKIAKFQAIMEQIRQLASDNLSPSELIEAVIKWTGYRELIRKDQLTAEMKLDYLQELIKGAKEYADLGSFLEDAALLSSSDSQASGHEISLMTMHAAKGLEFPVVIVIGFEEGTFPHARVFEKPEELEEERRLCYVAMTRAKERLYLFYANSRFIAGNRQSATPSRFLTDAGLIDGASNDNYDHWATSDDVLIDTINEFNIGDRVRSGMFGAGEVIDVDGLAVTIRFDNNQIRKLNIEFAKLELL
ncbi:MAG: 3'-5' exonuclease [Candidatus Saccharibacteria bacterium]|nr:3'-5' exonuclease [Candidatus Saccharibacteria bacterium]